MPHRMTSSSRWENFGPRGCSGTGLPNCAARLRIDRANAARRDLPVDDDPSRLLDEPAAHHRRGLRGRCRRRGVDHRATVRHRHRHSDELGRRLARNICHLLISESHVASTADPAAGAHALEALTWELAEAGWAEFQRIEGAGSIVTAVTDGSLQQRWAQSGDERAARIATRRQPITGLSESPPRGAPPTATDRRRRRSPDPFVGRTFRRNAGPTRSDTGVPGPDRPTCRTHRAGQLHPKRPCGRRNDDRR